jgi:hypothetical protein
MENKDFYRFSDFTLENYKRIIQITKNSEFKFIGFNDKDTFEKTVIWRHDVEFSPEIALQMAEIESVNNVKATYFFQLHSEFYNLLERYNSDILLKIQSLGHEIGLHFDSHYFNVNTEDELEYFLHLDATYFEKIFNVKINTFSFHNTNESILKCKKLKYAGLTNVYSDFYKENYAYCADSTGYWRFEILENVLCDPSTKKIQVLTHDGMWQNRELSPRQRIFKVIDDRSQYMKKIYDDGMKNFGVKNIDWDIIY